MVTRWKKPAGELGSGVATTAVVMVKKTMTKKPVATE
jgi:hypothetical protein